MINYRLQIAERLGGEKTAILQQAKVTSQQLAKPENRISLQEERALWRSMVDETGREDIGIICGLNFPIQSTGLIGYVMMNSPSIGVALRKFCVYQKLIGDSMGIRMEDTDDYTTVYLELWTTWYEELRFTTDTFLGACFSWLEKNSVTAVRPVRVGFHYQEPTNAQDYRDAFAPAPVSFGEEVTYLVYRRKDLDATLLSQNSEMLTFFEKQVREKYQEFEGNSTLTRQTRRIILDNMEGEAPGIEQVASQMTMSVRTLQKALKAENTSYQRLLNDVRKETAIAYLKKGVLSKSEIAFLLGFSDLSVFSRNFKKWTGYAPSQYPV